MIDFCRALHDPRQRERADFERDYTVLSERQTWERVLAAEQRTIEIFDSISDGLFVFDSAFNYLYPNP
jgi:PAS domain-containing protein